MFLENNKTAGKTKYAVLLLVIALLLACILSSPSTAEMQLLGELRALKVDRPTSLIELESLRPHTQICILSPYSVRAGAMQEESLNRIFGNVDYSQFQRSIIQKHTSDYFWAFYPVARKRVQAQIEASGIRYKLRGLYLEYAQGFRSGCYETATVCLTKSRQNKFEEFPIVVSHCQ
jgi:hypothetical protein